MFSIVIPTMQKKCKSNKSIDNDLKNYSISNSNIMHLHSLSYIINFLIIPQFVLLH